MVQIDDRIGSKEMAPILSKLVPCEVTRLEYGDACFSGNGKTGEIAIGVERKTLNDMLNCIEDARYAAHQRPGMLSLYSKSFLIIEGLWCCGSGNGYDGILMQGFRGGMSWGPLRTRSNRQVLYTKLFNYLLSVSLSGVVVIPSRDIVHTCCSIAAMHSYFQKKWTAHTSLIECQKFAIPTLDGKPTLVRRWAHDIEDIGVKFSEEAERLFRSPIRLAESEESDWTQIRGVGMDTAKRIIAQIRGWRVR